MSYLRWLWRDERSVARLLAIAVAVLLICAPEFAVAEIAVLSTLHVVHAQHPAVIHLGAGTYDISEDIGDADFPTDATEISISGADGRVPGLTLSPKLTLDDRAGTFLGAWDCSPVVSFTIARAGPYRITVEQPDGISAVWISEPYADVDRHVLPWAVGVAVALLAIALCLATPGRRWRLMRRRP